MTLVSYLVVAHKSRATIGATVRSICEQSGDFDKEIVLIDNFASDNCAAEVLRLAPQARVSVNSKNLGFAHAVNQALAKAGGDFLFIVNPDAKLSPDCTEILLATLRAMPRAGAVAPQLRHDDGDIQASIRNLPSVATILYEVTGISRILPSSPRFGHWRNPGFDYGKPAVVEQPMASALLLRKEAVARVGDWDEQFFVFFSDVDYCKRLMSHDYQIVYEPAAVAHHLGGGSTRQESSWLIYDSHRGFYRYLVKHESAGRLQLAAVKVLLLWGAVVRDLKRRFWRRLF